MNLIKNPFFMTAMLFFVVGCLALSLNWMTGLMLLVIGLFAAVAGLLSLRRSSRRAHEVSAPGMIRLHS